MLRILIFKGNFYLLPIVFFALCALKINAQDDLNPIKWSVKEVPQKIKSGESFKVEIVAKIDEGWHLYSLEQSSGGPIPTRITLPDNQKFKLSSDIESPVPQIVYDTNFNMDTQFYEYEAVFKIPVEVLKEAAAGKNTLVINTFFQTCNDKTCLPPKTVRLNADIEVTGGSSTTSDSATSIQTVASKPEVAVKSIDSTSVDFKFVDFNGKSRSLSEFRGKFVLLDFWATWCRPCLADIPKLKELYEKYGSSGFEIIGMDSETIRDEAEAPDPEFAKETAERAKQIIKTRGVTWTQATSETAVPTAIKVFGVKALPTKILIDKEGKIIATIGEKDDLTGIVGKLLSENK